MRTRVLVGAALALVLLGLWQPGASAHVTVQPPEAAAGGYTKLAFRVPNERPTAATVRLRVQFPADHPFASVSVKPVPGWTPTVVKSPLATPIEREGRDPVTEAVTEISWEGGSIKPGEFQEFEVSVGPVPTDVTSLSFPAIQVYDNGEEVLWSETPTPGGPEPERPAPTLKITAATGHGGASPAAAGTTTTAPVAAVSSTPVATDSGSSNGLAAAALVVGGLGAVLALVALVRGGRSGA